jgi:hypothetical protein
MTVAQLIMEVAKGNLVDCSDAEGENWSNFYVVPTSANLSYSGIWEQYTSPVLGGGLDCEPLSMKGLKARLSEEIRKGSEIQLLK